MGRVGTGSRQEARPSSATLPICPHTVKILRDPTYRGAPAASLPEGIAVPTSLASSLPSHPEPEPVTAAATSSRASRGSPPHLKLASWPHSPPACPDSFTENQDVQGESRADWEHFGP